jgi:hypothetical protein
MINCENVIVNINHSNKKYYEKLGYNTDNDSIIVKISDIPKGSHIEIPVICDYCGNEKIVSMKTYNENIKKTNKYSCSYKCGALKLKENNFLKYGVESTFELSDVKEKIKKTNLIKYGVEHVSQIQNVKDSKKIKYDLNKEEISLKIKNTWNNKTTEEIQKINNIRENTTLKIYNLKNISQDIDVKEKKKQTFDMKYSGFTYSSKELSDKVNITLLEKYGTTNIASLFGIQTKIKDTNLIKYGFERPTQNNEIKNKIKNTFKERYDVDNIMFLEDFRKYNYIIAKDSNYIQYVGGLMSQFKCDCGKDHIYEIATNNYFQRKYRNCKICTVCYPIDANVSIKEKELKNFIQNIYDGTIIENYRDHYEIDVFLPDIKIGFEFNGLYWHSDKYIEKDKHLKKLNYFKEKGIRIIYIWEDDWDFRSDILKSQIKNWLNLTENKIFARKCQIKEIDDINIIRQFLNNNHIQGFIHSVKKIGLFYNNELVSIMTFDKMEGRKKLQQNEWNLSRFCNKLDTNVIGAASKLLSYFIKNYESNRIISYSDKAWSDGKLYYMLGFNLLYESKINYKYIVNNKRINKQHFTKKKLKCNDTEKNIMSKLNIPRIYDCGQYKFEMINKKAT